MKTYEVTIPIAGHAFMRVEASSEKEAHEKALLELRRDDIEEWDALDTFMTGNVCHCPQPWEVEIEEQS